MIVCILNGTPPKNLTLPLLRHDLQHGAGNKKPEPESRQVISAVRDLPLSHPLGGMVIKLSYTQCSNYRSLMSCAIMELSLSMNRAEVSHG
jgi:hypothetical protein